MSIRTERLELVAMTVELIDAELRGAPALARRLGAPVPASWPPELYDRAAAEFTRARLDIGADQRGWWGYYMILRHGADAPAIVGTCGYKGPPGADGAVEIGYSVLAPYRRRGLATEASRGLIGHALRDPAVRRITAETLPELAASIGVLEKLGFHRRDTIDGDGVLRFELDRAAAAAVTTNGRRHR